MKKTAITDDLIVFSDGFVWKRLSRKTAEALWNSVISHELELYWVRTDDESEAAIELRSMRIINLMEIITIWWMNLLMGN